MQTLLLLQAEQHFVGAFASNNNFFFVGKKDDRVAKLDVTWAEVANDETAHITIQARFYQQNYQNSPSYLFCGQGFYWDQLKKIETHLYLDICKHSTLNEAQEYSKAEAAGEEWPTKEYLRHNESINSNPDDCTFTLYSKISSVDISTHYVPADLYEYYKYLEDGKRLDGYVVSYDCGITFYFGASQSIPNYQDQQLVFQMVISLLMLLSGLFTVRILDFTADYDYIVVGQWAWWNADIYAQFILMFYAIASYVHIAFMLTDQLNKFLFCVFAGTLQLYFVDYRIVVFLRARASSSNGQVISSPWVIGLLIVLILVVVVILSYCFIYEFYVYCHIIILIFGFLTQLFRLFKPLFSGRQFTVRPWYIFVVSSYYFLSQSYLYFTIQLVAGRNNALQFQQLGASLRYFWVAQLVVYIVSFCEGLYQERRKRYVVDFKHYPYCHSYLRQLTPDHYDEEYVYLLMPFAKKQAMCHNPFHKHSCYFGQQALFVGSGIVLREGMTCFLIVSPEKIEGEKCQICLEMLGILYQRERKLLDLQSRYADSDFDWPEIQPGQQSTAYHGGNFGFGLGSVIFPDISNATPVMQSDMEQQVEVYEEEMDEPGEEQMQYEGLPAQEKWHLFISSFEQPSFLPFGGKPHQPVFGFNGLAAEHFDNEDYLLKPSVPLKFPIKVSAALPPQQKARPVYILKCGHVFHRECLDLNVRDGNQGCPICRKQVVVPLATCRRKRAVVFYNEMRF